jgi:hypothetical protein
MKTIEIPEKLRICEYWGSNWDCSWFRNTDLTDGKKRSEKESSNNDIPNTGNKYCVKFTVLIMDAQKYVRGINRILLDVLLIETKNAVLFSWFIKQNKTKL